jgi:transcriptional regulator with XRE-family HTH domain
VFYDRYAQLCKQRGIAETTAAQKAGLSKSLVTKWRTNNVKVPSPDVLKKLSAYFCIPISELLGEENEQKSPTIPEDDGASIDRKELMERIKTLPEEKIQLLLQVAKSIE